ncbi:MAG: hypothetical protein ABI866_08005, partial [Dokdonella sp.]
DGANKAPNDNALGQAFETSATSLGLEAKDLDRKQRLEKIDAEIRQTVKALKGASLANSDVATSRLLVLAYLAAHLNAQPLAESALAQLGEDLGPTYSMSRKLQVIAMAELDRANGQPEQALAKLKALLDGSEPYIAHVALMNAYASASELALAFEEARWLVTHRGRAYAEYYPAQILIAYNIEQSNVALLRGAELALARKDSVSARTLLAEFITVWPDAASQPAWQERTSRLQKKLSEIQSP